MGTDKIVERNMVAEVILKDTEVDVMNEKDDIAIQIPVLFR